MTTPPPLTSRRARLAALLVVLPMLSTIPARAGFVVQDLGTLARGFDSAATGINSKGAIVGIASLPGLRTSGFIGQGSSLTAVGSPVLNGNSAAYGISSSGAVVGAADFQSGGWLQSVQTHAFKSVGGVVLDLKTASPADGFSVATGINGGGTMVGASGLDSSHFQAMRINGPGAFTPLGGLGGQQSMATAISDNSVIVGWARTAGGDKHAAIFNGPGGVTDLGTIGGASSSVATGVNARGDVIGYAGDAGSAASFIKLGNAPLVPLGSLPFATSILAAGINQLDLVVGVAQFGNGSVGFIRDPATGRLYDISSLIDAGGYQIVGAAGINDSNQVAATALVDGVQHVLLLTPDSGGIFVAPVPEPGSWLLLALGGAGLVGLARLRRGRTAAPGAGGPAGASPGC